MNAQTLAALLAIEHPALGFDTDEARYLGGFEDEHRLAVYFCHRGCAITDPYQTEAGEPCAPSYYGLTEEEATELRAINAPLGVAPAR